MRRIHIALVLFILSLSVHAYSPSLYECVEITKGIYNGYMGWVQGGCTTESCSYYMVDIYHPTKGCIAKNSIYNRWLAPCSEEIKLKYRNAQVNAPKKKYIHPVSTYNTTYNDSSSLKVNSDWLKTEF